MRSRGKIFVVIAFAFAILVYQLLIHKVTISGQLTPITASLVLVPFVIAVCWAIAAELGMRLALLLTANLAVIALAAVNFFGLPNPAIIFGMPHLMTNLFLMWFFMRTLKAGREPLITSIALRVHGSLTPDLEIYTRRVTLAWGLFFVLQVAGSIGLYAFASMEAWSIFINILNTPLIVLMFLFEYIYRVLRYREHHSSPLDGIKTYLQDSPAPKSATKANNNV
jgi:uncharacterized membrane protein